VADHAARARTASRRSVDELVAATARGTAVTGLGEVWQLAVAKRGRLLVVEEDYRGQPSREVDGRLVTLSDGPEHAPNIDDPVDEIVEQCPARRRRRRVRHP